MYAPILAKTDFDFKKIVSYAPPIRLTFRVQLYFSKFCY